MFRGVNARHDQYLEELARTMRRDLGLIAVTGQHLNKDYESNKSTDLYIVFPVSTDECPISVDYTCLCPFLKKYRGRAKRDFRGMLEARANDKTNKHKDWCKQMGRLFVAAPGTTLGGTGTTEYWGLIDKVFTRGLSYETKWREATDSAFKNKNNSSSKN